MYLRTKIGLLNKNNCKFTLSTFFRKSSSSRLKTNNRFTKYVFPTSITSNITHKLNHARDSWEMIGQLMEKQNKNKKHEIKKDTQDENERKNTERIAENISNMKHNFSSKLENHFEFYYWSQFIITSYLHILYSIIIIIGISGTTGQGGWRGFVCCHKHNFISGIVLYRPRPYYQEGYVLWYTVCPEQTQTSSVGPILFSYSTSMIIFFTNSLQFT